MENALVSDFDGTITQNDFFALVAERYMAEPRADYLGMYRQGLMTHFDAMASYFAHTPADDSAAIEALLRDTKPDPDLAASIARLRAASWDLIIVSAGCTWYIERILAAVGVSATVYSNPGQLQAGCGLVLERDRAGRFYSENVGVDKPGVVRDALSRYKRVAFAGDGPPDLEPALLVAPELRFARSYLADALLERGESFRPFTRWSEIVNQIA